MQELKAIILKKRSLITVKKHHWLQFWASSALQVAVATSGTQNIVTTVYRRSPVSTGIASHFHNSHNSEIHKFKRSEEVLTVKELLVPFNRTKVFEKCDFDKNFTDFKTV